MIAGDNRPLPVGCRWKTLSTACGSPFRPQPVEIACPRIHNRLTWPDSAPSGSPVDRIGTTSRSPGCGREKLAESVEEGRNPVPDGNSGRDLEDDRATGDRREDGEGAAEGDGRCGTAALGGTGRHPKVFRVPSASGTAGRRAYGKGVPGPHPGTPFPYADGSEGAACPRGPGQLRAGTGSPRAHHGRPVTSPWSRVSDCEGAGRPQPALMRLVSSVTWL